LASLVLGACGGDDMSNVERLLSDDLTRLLDRLGASVPEGTLGEIRTKMPELSTRLDGVERKLSSEYAALVESYGRWRRTLEDLENLWALAAYRSSVLEEPRRAA
jgi:hypothetical protein